MTASQDEHAAPQTGRGQRRWWPLRLVLGTYRTVRAVLALGMILIILAVATPITEQVYLWLAVSGPAKPADVMLCLGGNAIREHRSAWLYHQGYARTVVVSNRPVAALGMKQNLVLCSVPPDRILVDSDSTNTWDHPTAIAALPGIDPKQQNFLIVTDHWHARRVEAVFRNAGYEHFTIYGGRPPLQDGVDDGKRWRWRVMKLPHIMYELAALTQYWLQGRIDAPWTTPSPYLQSADAEP